MRLATGWRLLAPVVGFLGILGTASPGYAIQMIGGSLPFSSVNQGSVPFSVFGGLMVDGANPIDFTVSYDETVGNTSGSPNVAEFAAITQVSLTIDGTNVVLNPGAAEGDFSPTESQIRINTLTDILIIDIRNAGNVATGEQQVFRIDLQGPGGLLSQSIDPLGGVASLSLTDFSVARTASISGGPIIPVLDLREVAYDAVNGTITFPNSVTPPPPPPPTPAIPEPSTLSLLVMGLLGMAWMRRRRDPTSLGRLSPAP